MTDGDNFGWPPESTDPVDHYQDDGFKEVKHLSPGNLLIATMLILIIAFVLLDVMMTPSSPEVDSKPEVVIPWTPHPKQAPESLFR